MSTDSAATALAVPLSSFAIPESMHDAVAADSLTKLILENVLDFDEYKRHLELCRSPSIPPLSSTIDTLILSNFLLGYPPGFLTALGGRIADLKNLTIARQRFTGMSMKTAREAEHFITRIQDLVDLHMVDVFLPHGFLSVIGEHQKKKPKGRDLVVLQVDYTYREVCKPGGDPINDTLERMSIPELHTLVTPGLAWMSFKMLPHDAEGIIPYWRHATEPLVTALTREETAPKVLKHFKITAFQLSLDDLRTVLGKHRRIMNLDVTLRLETTDRYLESLWEILGLCPNLCQVEIIWYPVMPLAREVRCADVQ